MSKPEKMRAFTAWMRVKERLRSEMDPRDFNHFVRPMYLLRPLGECLLVALPPNARIVERARTFSKSERFLAALNAEGYGFAGFTRYPTDDELVALEAWEPWLSRELLQRRQNALEKRAAEDARDAAFQLAS